MLLVSSITSIAIGMELLIGAIALSGRTCGRPLAMWLTQDGLVVLIAATVNILVIWRPHCHADIKCGISQISSAGEMRLRSRCGSTEYKEWREDERDAEQGPRRHFEHGVHGVAALRASSWAPTGTVPRMKILAVRSCGTLRLLFCGRWSALFASISAFPRRRTGNLRSEQSRIDRERLGVPHRAVTGCADFACD